MKKNLACILLLVIISYTGFSCNDCNGWIWESCPPAPGTVTPVDSSNPLAWIIAVANNNCINCTGSGNYSIQNFVENETAQKIIVSYSYDTYIRQPSGNLTHSPTIKNNVSIPAKGKILIGCGCQNLTTSGDMQFLNLKIINVTQ